MVRTPTAGYAEHIYSKLNMSHMQQYDMFSAFFRRLQADFFPLYFLTYLSSSGRKLAEILLPKCIYKPTLETMVMMMMMVMLMMVIMMLMIMMMVIVIVIT